MYTKVTPGWELGKWLVICERCARKRVSDEVAKEPWTNLMVCKDTCWEPRHPQEFIRAKPDPQGVPFTSPEATDRETNIDYDTTTGTQNHTIPDGTFDNSLD